MLQRRPALPALALTSAMLVAGCTDSSTPADVASDAPMGLRAHAPRDAGPTAKETLTAALTKTAKAAYAMNVDADLPDDSSIKASGGYDGARKRLKLLTDVKGQSARKGQLIVIGDDSYSRGANGETWVHLDQARLKKDALEKIDMTDPTGLARFTEAIGTVRKTGATSFEGEFDASRGTFADPVIPVGAPAFYGFGGALATTPFTATTDASGWVTSIVVTVEASPELTMTTKFSKQGQDSGIKKPGNTAEAADFYYD